VKIRFVSHLAHHIVMLVCSLAPLVAQDNAPVPGGARVPFVGCGSLGQIDATEAPVGSDVSLPISPVLARQLAFYQTAQGMNTLGPRGWRCLGLYGSGSSSLLISPDPIEPHEGLSGSAIERIRSFRQTSGVYEIGGVVARVFPAYRSLYAGLFNDYPNLFLFGPYPSDRLRYRSKSVVEYRTPAQKLGLGTRHQVQMNGNPIDGVAALVGEVQDLVLLAVRLPSDQAKLTVEIIRQVERDITKEETADRHR
jgi:hypothetical protein